MIGYKNVIPGGSSIMKPIRIPENTRNGIFLMNLIISNSPVEVIVYPWEYWNNVPF